MVTNLILLVLLVIAFIALRTRGRRIADLTLQRSSLGKALESAENDVMTEQVRVRRLTRRAEVAEKAYLRANATLGRLYGMRDNLIKQLNVVRTERDWLEIDKTELTHEVTTLMKDLREHKTIIEALQNIKVAVDVSVEQELTIKSEKTPETPEPSDDEIDNLVLDLFGPKKTPALLYLHPDGSGEFNGGIKIKGTPLTEIEPRFINAIDATNLA